MLQRHAKVYYAKITDMSHHVKKIQKLGKCERRKEKYEFWWYFKIILIPLIFGTLERKRLKCMISRIWFKFLIIKSLQRIITHFHYINRIILLFHSTFIYETWDIKILQHSNTQEQVGDMWIMTQDLRVKFNSPFSS